MQQLLLAVLLCSTLLFSISYASLPAELTNVNLIYVDAYSASIGWDRPSDYGGYHRHETSTITRLFIQGQLWREEITSSSSDNRVQLQDLLINTTYLFSVVIKNPEGEGNQTTLSFSTSEYGVPSKIRNFYMTTNTISRTSSSATFVWDEPLFDGNSPITNYTLFCTVNLVSEDPINNPENENIDAVVTVEEGRFYTYEGLPARAYYCNAVASNSYGYGSPLSLMNEYFSSVTGVVGKVKNVTVDTITTTSAHLSWNAVLSTFPLSPYVISYYDTVDVKHTRVVTPTGEDREIILTGLEIGRDYVLTITAVDIHSVVGKESEEIYFTTPHYICSESE